MQTIVLASRKGGAGKTTLAAHLAVEAESRGAGPVALIDTDPMGGLAAWWNARKADTPQFAQVGEGGLTRTLAELRDSGIKLVVIDTPPAATEAIASIIRAADLVVVPVIPSPNDLRATGETLELVEEQRRPLAFVINNASTNGRLTAQAATALSQHGTLSALKGEPVIIRTRQDFRSSMTSGGTVTEARTRTKSADEIRDLWMSVAARLAKEARHGAVA